MPINQVRPDTPLANTPEPRIVQDTIKPKTWQRMTVAEKGAKKAELIKKGGMERFKQYKDSISTDATNRREAEINKAAANKGMTKEEYAKWYKKNEKKPDQPCGDLDIKGANKRGASKGSCSTGVKNKGESLKDTN
jgi:hypothetical protein